MSFFSNGDTPLLDMNNGSCEDMNGDPTYFREVTITTREYRELCGKAALWDEYRADAERWCEGGES